MEGVDVTVALLEMVVSPFVMVEDDNDNDVLADFDDTEEYDPFFEIIPTLTPLDE